LFAVAVTILTIKSELASILKPPYGFSSKASVFETVNGLLNLGPCPFVLTNKAPSTCDTVFDSIRQKSLVMTPIDP